MENGEWTYVKLKKISINSDVNSDDFLMTFHLSFHNIHFDIMSHTTDYTFGKKCNPISYR